MVPATQTKAPKVTVAELIDALDAGAPIDPMDPRLDALEVPPLPAVATRVLELAADPDADARKLASLVERDPGLAAAVLRAVRSPMWAGSVPIATLHQAIARVGFRPLTEIVVAACLRPKAVTGPNAAEITTAWRHAVATASFARRISAVRRRHVESGYLCGLLHSIGKLVLLGAPVPVAPEQLEACHATVGAAVARRWRLPDVVVHTIAHHTRWKAAGAQWEEAATTWLASRLALEADATAAVDEDPVLERLTLYPDDLESLRGQRGDVRADVAGLA